MKTMTQKCDFLPVTAQEMHARGWEQADFVYVSGDAYVDHPSFGAAIISRVLEDAGYRVAMLCQPNWKEAQDFCRFGRPRLGFLVSSGNIDSMVAHYTAAKRRRSKDAYSPGGEAGLRPDRAVTVYTKMLKKALPGLPGHYRRAGGVAAPFCPLRLLVRFHPAVRFDRIGGGSADLWHG